MPQVSFFPLALDESQKQNFSESIYVLKFSRPAYKTTDEGEQEKHEEQEKQNPCDTNCRRGDSEKTKNRCNQRDYEKYDCPTQHVASFVAEQDR
jgi:hypothetical protein